MTFASRLNKFSIGLALISFVSAASAQSLRGVNATLDHNIDSKTAAVGQVVTAKLNGSLKADGGVNLPRGTELLGKIAEAKPSQNNGPASISLVFTTAKLKDGKEVPVKVTLLAAYPEGDGEDAAYAGQMMGPAPDSVSSDATIDQTPGALHNVSLQSAVKNSDSGTFFKTSGDFRLSAGTYFQVGVAPAGNAGATSAAE